MSFKGALERLKAYEPKRLIAAQYQDGLGDCCAIGAICPETRLMGAERVSRFWRDWEPLGASLEALGLREWEAVLLQRKNDALFCGRTSGVEERRYEGVLAWLEAQVAKETV
jgi:hypothetical protein